MTLSGLWFGHTGLSEERQGNTECGYIHWSSYSSWKIPSVTAAGQSKSTEKRSRAECAQTCWKWKRMWDEIKNVWKRWEKMSVSAYLCGTAEVIVIDLFYGLEVDHTLQLGLMFVCGKEGRKENNTSLVKRLKCIDDDRLFLGCNSWGTSPHIT